MWEYKILDKKYASKLFKVNKSTRHILSVIIGTYYFLVEHKKEYSQYKAMSGYYNNYSKIKRLIMSWKNYYYEILFIFHYGYLIYADSKKITKLVGKVEIINSRMLEDASKNKQATIIFTAHTGCVFVALYKFKIPINKKCIVLSPKNHDSRKKLLENSIQLYDHNQSNALRNIEFVSIEDNKCIYKIIETLKSGGVIFCTMDYAYPFTNNKKVSFLNTIREFPIGILKIGMKYNATMIPVFHFWKRSKYSIVVKQPFVLESINKNKDHSLINNVKVIADIIENNVLEHPQQWTMWPTLINNQNNYILNEKYITQKENLCLYSSSNSSWNNEWLNEMVKQVNSSVNKVNQYIKLDSIPNMILIHNEDIKDIKKDWHLPDWVKAITIKDNVYILLSEDNKRWKDILSHEIFHVAIYTFFNGHYIIPDWFNELMAYRIGNNLFHDDEQVRNYVTNNFKTITKAITADTILSKDSMGYPVIKSLGCYLSDHYNENIINNLFSYAKENNFEESFEYVFNRNIKELLIEWKDAVINKEIKIKKII